MCATPKVVCNRQEDSCSIAAGLLYNGIRAGGSRAQAPAIEGSTQASAISHNQNAAWE